MAYRLPDVFRNRSSRSEGLVRQSFSSSSGGSGRRSPVTAVKDTLRRMRTIPNVQSLVFPGVGGIATGAASLGSRAISTVRSAWQAAKAYENLGFLGKAKKVGAYVAGTVAAIRLGKYAATGNPQDLIPSPRNLAAAGAAVFSIPGAIYGAVTGGAKNTKELIQDFRPPTLPETITIDYDRIQNMIDRSIPDLQFQNFPPQQINIESPDVGGSNISIGGGGASPGELAALAAILGITVAALLKLLGREKKTKKKKKKKSKKGRYSR